MRNRKQSGQVLRIGDNWHVRYWERRNVNGVITPKRVTHHLGPVTTRGKHPPADIKTEAERHMMTVNAGVVTPSRIVTVDDFVEKVYLPSVELHKRPSTAKGYADIWHGHLKKHCSGVWLKNVRTFDVQQWLNKIGETGLSRNTLKHLKSVISGIFKLAKQQGYFEGENPARDTSTNPAAPEPQETYAYSLDEVQVLLNLLPEPAATVFAVAAFSGLRIGEIQGLRWEDYRDGELHVMRSIWNGRVNPPKTSKSRAPVPVIRQLAERLEIHRKRIGKPKTGPMFPNQKNKPAALAAGIVNRVILPTLNRCEVCRKAEVSHGEEKHQYKRDGRYPEWHGWHAARRGLGSNLYRLGVPDKVIQQILRHANVSTTTGYYIKTAADDVRKAMKELENIIPESLTDTYRTLN